MKIICTQENLKGGLATVGRIISPSNTLPILNNILIKTENGILKISSTNLEVAITTQVRCKVEEEGEVTVLSKTIIDLVNNLPNKNITLESQGSKLNIDTENYHTSVNTLPAEEFPLIPEVVSTEIIDLDGQILKNAIDQVVFAVSSNQTQPEISGVYLHVENTELKLVATDRYRLAERVINLEAPSLPQQVIIPHKTIIELSRIIGNSEGKVGIIISDSQISLSVNQTQIISRLIDGQYPDYQQIIPQNFTTIIHTPKQAFVNGLRAGAIFSQNTNSVNFEYSAEKQSLTITAESPELGKSVVELPSQVEGGNGSLILNHHYILDCLGSIEAQNVIVKITNDSSPSLILPEGKNDYIYLVMPIKS